MDVNGKELCCIVIYVAAATAVLTSWAHRVPVVDTRMVLYDCVGRAFYLEHKSGENWTLQRRPTGDTVVIAPCYPVIPERSNGTP